MEAIRALMVAKRTAKAQRTQTINQARALSITGPDDVRTRFTGQAAPAGHVAELAALRPRPGSMVRSRRAQFIDDQLARLDELITPLVAARAPGLLSLFGASSRSGPCVALAVVRG